jgi:hypothetical protein
MQFIGWIQEMIIVVTKYESPSSQPWHYLQNDCWGAFDFWVISDSDCVGVGAELTEHGSDGR